MVGAVEIASLRRVPRPLFVWTLLVLMALVAAACSPSATENVATPAAGVTFVIPSGTKAALERGEPAFQFPDEIRVRAGQSVVITNHDYAMHYFFDIPVAPGQTIRKPFARSGEFVYQGGLSCSISRSNTIRVRVE
jgi:hypothetical protein